MSTWKGIEWAIWLHSFGDELPAQPKFWFDILVLFTWNVSYKAMYELAYVLHNPFGDREPSHASEFRARARPTSRLSSGNTHFIEWGRPHRVRS